MINDEKKPLLPKENDSKGCKEVGKHIANTTVIGATFGGIVTGAVPAVVGMGIGATVGTCLSTAKEGAELCGLGLGLVGSVPGAREGNVVETCLSTIKEGAEEGAKICGLGWGLVGSVPGAAAGGTVGFFSGLFTSPIAFFCGASERYTEVRQNITDMITHSTEPAQLQPPQLIIMTK